MSLPENPISVQQMQDNPPDEFSFSWALSVLPEDMQERYVHEQRAQKRLVDIMRVNDPILEPAEIAILGIIAISLICPIYLYKDSYALTTAIVVGALLSFYKMYLYMKQDRKENKALLTAEREKAKEIWNDLNEEKRDQLRKLMRDGEEIN